MRLLRRMQVWSAEGFAAVDFAARTATLVRPSETLRRRRFHVDGLTPEGVDYYRAALCRRALAAGAIDASTPSMPWLWNWTILSARSARRASRGSTARRAATRWPWPSRFSIASTPTVGTLRSTAWPARWPYRAAKSYFPRSSARRKSPRPSFRTKRAREFFCGIFLAARPLECSDLSPLSCCGCNRLTGMVALS